MRRKAPRDIRLTSTLAFAPTPTGRIRHASGEQLPRHCHREPFAAVVLKGRYLEAGDAGRMQVTAGDVLLHGPYESHFDDVGTAGAEVLVLPWTAGAPFEALGRITDPDAVARAAERSADDAMLALAEQFRPVLREHQDWPDRLACDLRSDPTLSITAWCDLMGLRPESVSRGFRKAFGVSPKAFRARARLLQSLPLISSGEKLAEIAAACGFADQSHLGREFLALTGHTPSRSQKDGRQRDTGRRKPPMSSRKAMKSM